jgi:hypothetical protein
MRTTQRLVETAPNSYALPSEPPPNAEVHLGKGLSLAHAYRAVASLDRKTVRPIACFDAAFTVSP